MAIPMAGTTSAARSCAEAVGTAGTGRPAGISPTTATPAASSDHIATAAVAKRTAMSGPGSRGVHRPSVHNSINTAAASTAVGQCTSRRWASNDLTNSNGLVSGYHCARDLSDLAGHHHDRDARHVSDEHWARQKVGQKAQPRDATGKADSPDHERKDRSE